MKKFLAAAVLASSISAGAIASTPALINTSFESQNLATSYLGYLYSIPLPQYGLGPSTISADGWSFSVGSGLSYSNTAWGGVAADGNVFAFLQHTGGISQSFNSSSTDTYTFSFSLEQRSSWRVGGPQTVTVQLDGDTIWSGTPTDSWQTYTTTPITKASGTHTLSFIGTNLNGASDTSAFVDRVGMSAVAAVPEPETYAMLLAGVGLMGGIARRRKAQQA